MILQLRSLRRLPVSAQLSLVLLGLLVLPLSTKAQVAVEPATPAEPTVEAQVPVEAQPAAEAQPAVRAVAPVEAAPPRIEATFDSTISTAPVVATVQAQPSLEPAATNNIEQRLRRLEKLVETIAAEMKNQRRSSPPATSYRAATNHEVTGIGLQRITSADARSPLVSRDRATRATSLSDLRKHRIDLEDQLDNLKKQLDEVDQRIAKLQGERQPYSGQLSPK